MLGRKPAQFSLGWACVHEKIHLLSKNQGSSSSLLVIAFTYCLERITAALGLTLKLNETCLKWTLGGNIEILFFIVGLNQIRCEGGCSKK